jgi:light-independent protochlorophyllide reductase subunit B
VSPVADVVHEAPAGVATAMATSSVGAQAPNGEPVWSKDAEMELHKIPFFVRGKVRRNTEMFARERKIQSISAETLYDAKAHYSR